MSSLSVNFLMVFLGGGIGSMARYLISIGIDSSSFPKATFMANMLSCVMLGMLIDYNAKHILDSKYKLLLMTGFCGGFSTFSTFSSEIFSSYQNGDGTVAIVYTLASILCGVACILLGMIISKLLFN